MRAKMGCNVHNLASVKISRMLAQIGKNDFEKHSPCL